MLHAFLPFLGDPASGGFAMPFPPLPRLGITPSSGALKSRRVMPGTLMLRSIRSLKKIKPAASARPKHRSERNIQYGLRLVRTLRHRGALHNADRTDRHRTV